MEQHHSATEREWVSFDRDGIEKASPIRIRRVQNFHRKWYNIDETNSLFTSDPRDEKEGWIPRVDRLLQGCETSEKINQERLKYRTREI